MRLFKVNYDGNGQNQIRTRSGGIQNAENFTDYRSSDVPDVKRVDDEGEKSVAKSNGVGWRAEEKPHTREIERGPRLPQ